MKRRTFLAALMATVVGFVIKHDEDGEVIVAQSVSTDEIIYEVGYGVDLLHTHNTGKGSASDDSGFYFSNPNIAAYEYWKCGDKELTMYVFADGRTGLTQTSPSAFLHVLGGGA